MNFAFMFEGEKEALSDGSLQRRPAGFPARAGASGQSTGPQKTVHVLP
jgi:hypothetical protein